MKIEKLIQELKEYNQNADITLPYSEDICIGWICKDPISKKQLTKKTTTQLYIEGCDREE